MEEAPRRYYTGACAVWEDPEIIILKAPHGKAFGSIPLEFTTAGPNPVAIGKYVRHVMAAVADFPPESVIRRGEEVVTTASPLTAGVYMLECTLADFALRSGPIGKSRFRSFQEGSQPPSTVSRSSRSSQGQSKFRRQLISRDTVCAITHGGDFIACHIVPFSLGLDFLNRLLPTGDIMILDAYDEQNGMLLRQDLHASFDRYEWGVYVDDDEKLIVHVFVGIAQKIQYHGRQLRIGPHHPELRPPRREFFDWHYSQCLMARIRGFSFERLSVGRGSLR